MSTESSEANRSSIPRWLWLGVIVWSDDPEVEPTVIADSSSVLVARAGAVTIHEMLAEDRDGYAGATQFLESHPPPQDWDSPEHVRAWLDALQEATPHPSFSIHTVPVAGGADGTNRSAVNRYLQQALWQREQALRVDLPNPAEAKPPVERHLER